MCNTLIIHLSYTYHIVKEMPLYKLSCCLVNPSFSLNYQLTKQQCNLIQICHSDQRIVFSPANRNLNRFAEPTSVRIGIGIISESQNLQIGIGIIFVRWELFAKYSWISEIFFLSYIILIVSFSWLFYIFPLKNLPAKENYTEIYAHSLYIFLIEIRYSWILWKIFVNGNIIRQIKILGNRNNIHGMKLWRIGIRIYSWPQYQGIDLWQIYLRTICELFANRELFAEHWFALVFYIYDLTKIKYKKSKNKKKSKINKEELLNNKMSY